MTDAPFHGGGVDHYMVNPITRASQVLAEMSRRAAERNRALAAE